MHQTGTKHVVRHMQKSVIQWSVISKFTCSANWSLIRVPINTWLLQKLLCSRTDCLCSRAFKLGHPIFKVITLTMLRLLSSKPQGRKDFLTPLKPCHVGIHWIALAEYSQMSTYMPGFQSFFSFLHHFELAKVANSSIRVKVKKCQVTFFCG